MSKRKIITVSICTVVVCAIGYALAIYINPPSEPTVYVESSFVLPETAEIVNDVAYNTQHPSGCSVAPSSLPWVE